MMSLNVVIQMVYRSAPIFTIIAVDIATGMISFCVFLKFISFTESSAAVVTGVKLGRLDCIKVDQGGSGLE